MQTLFDMLWHVPVVGALGEVATLRQSVTGLAPDGLRRSNCARLWATSCCGRPIRRRSTPWRRSARFPRCQMPAEKPAARPLHVAVAYDDAFYCYFPDTLELLEARGATISDFSPLRDDRLPQGVDLVYLGCGHPEFFAATLAENDCMMLALKSHLCGGKRLYAECGGLAYLCQQIELADGQTWPMVGALQATARLEAAPALAAPLELTLATDTWLGPVSTPVRGYLNSRWSLTSPGGLQRCSATAGHELDLVGRHQAVGSRLHVNFAAQQNLLGSFFTPHAKPCEPPPVAPHAR